MNIDLLYDFLRKVDRLFPVALSNKTDLYQYSEKLLTLADLFVEMKNDRIVGLVAGYIKGSTDDKAYISLVAVLPEFQGKGIGKRLVSEFIIMASEYEKTAIHLYAVKTNLPAIKMYEGLGFVEWIIDTETRPSDSHLIYWIERDNL